VIDIQKLAKPREMRVMVESGRSPQRRASAIVHFHIGYAAPVGICMYLQHLGAENNVRPLFSTAMPRHVVHQMLQVLSIPYQGCSHRLEDQTPGLPKACRSRGTDTERVWPDVVCVNGCHAGKRAGDLLDDGMNAF
jgi:hypothetical protein